ncbi:MAG: hypothetical protein GAK30_00639 [Paracidovorax wautersii]|uniref:Transposase IS200-like domain-containing protein n=1 Tax=Paracidovorax wautersii TaxID=1177982 RepID=A0A7V8FRC1_9BURK|nr:MAG: hypothetical protein GAK30_00639 [Paracidovorax wautersii]
MARLPRLALAGHVHHIIQRGTDGQSIARDDDDRERWLALLGECAQAQDVAVHAYVLMPDHFHLLVTPRDAAGVSTLMQGLGRRYVRYFNDRHQRRGTLWEGRYRATVLEASRYLLPVMVHIDLNPVRAGLVGRADLYAWSSHRHYAGLQPSKLVKPHPQVWTLGNTPFAREAAYAEQVREGLSEAERDAIVAATRQGWALGDAAFVASLQKETERRLVKNRAGRPRRAPVLD